MAEQTHTETVDHPVTDGWYYDYEKESFFQLVEFDGERYREYSTEGIEDFDEGRFFKRLHDGEIHLLDGSEDGNLVEEGVWFYDSERESYLKVHKLWVTERIDGEGDRDFMNIEVKVFDGGYFTLYWDGLNDFLQEVDDGTMQRIPERVVENPGSVFYPYLLNRMHETRSLLERDEESPISGDDATLGEIEAAVFLFGQQNELFD